MANGGDLAGGLGKLVGGAKPVVANPGGKDDYSDAKIDTPDDLKLQK